jgi:hypothetical protein
VRCYYVLTNMGVEFEVPGNAFVLQIVVELSQKQTP